MINMELIWHLDSFGSNFLGEFEATNQCFILGLVVEDLKFELE